MAVKDIAYKYAVKNAFEHAGKANLGAVAGKVKALEPDADLKKVMNEIKSAVGTVNAMDGDELKKEYERFVNEGFELKPKEHKPGLPDLDWVDENTKVVTRYAPNPNGPFHLGNARAAITSHEYAKRYAGKFLLRFDDTDPKVKRPIADAEAIFKEDLEWLNCRVDETYFASDRFDIYYAHIEELMKKGHAYVCTCSVENWRNKIKTKEPCPCRELDSSEQAERFQKMLKHEYKEGQAVARIKTDLKHKDPSIRDWWLCRIVDKPEHPRVKDKQVWPSYNLASAIDDHLLGVTLIIRGQEHEQNETKQRFLYQYFGWEYPHAIYFGRIALQGAILSTSKIKKGIEEGLYIGWDDPRLGTIRALRRRGFKADALRRAIIELGVKSNDTTIEWSTLSAFDKELVVQKAEKMTFIKNPVKLSAEMVPKKEVEVNGIIYGLKDGLQNFFVEKELIGRYKAGDLVRLRNAYNVRIKSINDFEVNAEYAGDRKIMDIVPWLIEGLDIEVMMPDAQKIVGLGEERILDKKINDIIYFDRFGFVRLDSLEGVRPCVWFTHE